MRILTRDFIMLQQTFRSFQFSIPPTLSKDNLLPKINCNLKKEHFTIQRFFLLKIDKNIIFCL